jgi:hypothetical protein
MNCQQIDEYIFAYCDDTLSPDLRILIDEHLKVCEHCRTMVNLAQMEQQILSEVPDIPPLSEDFNQRLMVSLAGISASPAAPSGPVSFLSPLRFLAGGTIAAAAILLALYLPGLTSLFPDKQSFNIAEQQVQNESGAEQPGESGSSDRGFLEDNKQYDQGLWPAGDELSYETKSTTATNTDQEMNRSFGSPDYSQSVSSQKNSNRSFSLTVPAGNLTPDLDSEEDELDLLSLHPGNIPPEYKLDKIINTSYNAITYVYRNSGNSELLEITIASADDDAAPLMKSYADTAGLGGIPESECSIPEEGLLNTANISTNYGNQSLTINLKAAMPLDQLEELARSITFEEG